MDPAPAVGDKAPQLPHTQFNAPTEPPEQPRPKRHLYFSCIACKKLHKRCGAEKPECARCVKRGVECCYPPKRKATSGSQSLLAASSSSSTDRSSNSAGNDFDPQLDTSTLATPAFQSELGPIIVPSNSPGVHKPDLLFWTPGAPHSALMDPELVPTINDWVVVCKHLSSGRYNQLALDGKEFLANFFHEPPVLRLAWCSVSALFHVPKYPPAVYESYYARFSNSLMRVMHIPSIKTIEALVLICVSDLATGRPEDARKFFDIVLTMFLQLDLQNDCEHTEGFSDYEKDTRRRIFWVVFFSLKVMQVASRSQLPLFLDSKKVKYCRRLSGRPISPSGGSGGEFKIFDVAAICHLSSVLEVLNLIKHHHTQAPNNARDLINCVYCANFRVQLEIAKANIPTYLILDSEIDSIAFFSKFNLRNETARSSFEPDVVDTVTISTTYLAAKCVLLRPLLYLTGFLSIDSPVLVGQPDAIVQLLTALVESLSAASTVSQICSLIIHSSSDAFGEGGLGKKVWVDNIFTSFVLFESAVVLWFVTCRTRPFWWKRQQNVADSNAPGYPTDANQILRMTVEDRKRLRSGMVDILNTLKQMAVVFFLVVPLVTCVEEMVREMEAMENTEVSFFEGLIGPMNGAGGFESEADVITIGMKTMSIGVDAVVEHGEGQEPWCFLSLLGATVGRGKMRWNSFYEEPWRQFWKRTTAEAGYYGAL
ncbi:hypothetical protein HDU84_004298 [Entophlyctis sp. JEL0112]|nr:hypothetical protein HDU84_004298 [Entophlyctis sp. JEL0112]